MAKPRKPAPETCPICGEDLEPHYLSCPNCGSCHATGWKSDASGDGLGLDEDFDYDEFVEREFGNGAPPRRGRAAWVYWVALALLVGYALSFVLRRW